MISTRLVGASFDGGEALLPGPGGRGNLDGYAPVLVQLQEAAGRMLDVVERSEVAARAARLYKGGPALSSQQLNVSAD